MTIETKPEPIQINFHDRGRQVVVEPENHDKFVLSVEDAAVACQQAGGVLRFAKQFDELLKCLAQWLGQNEGKVAKAFVTVRGAELLFLVLGRSVAFDEDLENALTDLDLAVARNPQLGLIRLSVLALPNSSEEAYGSFLVPEHTWVFQHAK